MDENDLSDADTEDLAREYKKYLKDLEDLKAYGDMLARELGQRSLDQERRILRTNYGTFEGTYRSPYRKWDRDAISQEIYNLAKRGELHEPDTEGELPGSIEWRVYDGLRKMFRLEPKIGAIKKVDLDPDEYSVVEGKGYWSVRVKE